MTAGSTDARMYFPPAPKYGMFSRITRSAPNRSTARFNSAIVRSTTVSVTSGSTVSGTRSGKSRL
jgi:hypothetical protein